MVLTVPPPLVPGDLVAVVAPSSPYALGDMWRGLAWLRARYRLRLSHAALARDGYLAGTDDARAEDLSRAMTDPEVKAIVAIRGGYGAMRIMDRLPWAALVRRPKWLVGFSDVTALHAGAWAAGIASVHAPNVTTLAKLGSPRLRRAWIAALERPTAPRRFERLRVLHAGSARGVVVGGNLSLVHALATAARLRLPGGAILALEDTGEAPYRVDRMLTSLVMGGHLREVAGIVFGGFDRAGAGAGSIERVLGDCTRALGIPVLAGAPFGHEACNDAFVLGADARIAADTLCFGDDPSR